MDNQLAKYLSKDIKGIIAKIEVVQGTAKDSGKIYYAIETTFINGFTYRTYLRGAEQFAWLDAIELLSTQSQVEAQF